MKSVLPLPPLLALSAPALAGFVLSAPAAAQQHPSLITPIVTVVGTGSAAPLDRSGQSIAVVTHDEIAAVQGPDLTRVLTRLPGVTFSRNGGLGAQTGLNVRGGNADQLLVLIDGVRIADYASPGGGYDFGNLFSGTLDRIELLRGSNSVVWGSQAIAGVLAVTTREVDGAELSGEYGAHATAYGTAALGIARPGHAVSVSAGYVRSDNFSARSAGVEDDPYWQWQLSGKGRLALSEALSLRAAGRYADSRLDLDLSGPGPDSDDVQDTREGTGRVGLDYRSERLNLDTGLAYTDIRRDYDGPFGPSSFKGRAWRAEARGRAGLPSRLALDFGAESEWSRAGSSFDPARKARLSSGHALLGWYGPAASLAGGVRFDDHSRFGSAWTLGANGSVALGGAWRVRASYGEGFKAPTLYQLFGGFVGNPELKPETSRSYDAAVELGDRNAPLHLALTAFRRDRRNLIDLDSGFVYQNVARARAQGVEFELGARVTPRFAAHAAYTYLKARDRASDRDLARRPRHALSLAADWETPLAGLTLGGDVRLRGDSVEYDFLGTPISLDGFVVADARAEFAVSERVALFGRVENLGDADYETAAGFATAGRSAYLGARARF
jgi:vitamin B12 transporter